MIGSLHTLGYVSCMRANRQITYPLPTLGEKLILKETVKKPVMRVPGKLWRVRSALLGSPVTCITGTEGNFEQKL